MSKRKQRRGRAKTQLPPPSESPTSRGLTVLWMTTLLATVVSEVISLAIRLVSWLDASSASLLFSNLMLVISAASGTICLLLTPVVLRWRDTPPPTLVTQFAIAASMLPIVALAATLIWGN